MSNEKKGSCENEMKLVDADRLKIEISEMVIKNNYPVDKANEIYELINRQEIVYNVDQIVKQIEQIPENYSDNDVRSMIDDAVEFVKSGGVQKEKL